MKKQGQRSFFDKESERDLSTKREAKVDGVRSNTAEMDLALFHMPKREIAELAEKFFEDPDDGEWPKNRVLIVHEGDSVSVFADGSTMIKIVERPVAKTPKGNDMCDEILEQRLGMWSAMFHAPKAFYQMFFTDPRSPQERDGWWTGCYKIKP